MTIQSSKGIDARKKWAPGPFIQRHSPKWFLVRHSYVVCVDSPEEMNVYDVFLVDSDFTIDDKRDKKARDIASKTKAQATGHHILRLRNSERKMKLLARNDRQLKQFEDSIRFMASNTEWNNPHRFQSFAPVRKGIYAQWLVDGRDYMWNVSRAISMAKDVIYIHDWWLSPELYMRRPPAISQKWRLDRLLQRKAQEGVKVFVIMYRNINTAIPLIPNTQNILYWTSIRTSSFSDRLIKSGKTHSSGRITKRFVWSIIPSHFVVALICVSVDGIPLSMLLPMTN